MGGGVGAAGMGRASGEVGCSHPGAEWEVLRGPRPRPVSLEGSSFLCPPDAETMTCQLPELVERMLNRFHLFSFNSVFFWQ